MFETIIFEGQQYPTGNIVPTKKKTRLKRTTLKTLSLAEIKKLLEGRAKRRQLFGPDWIYNQGQIGSCNGCAGAKALERSKYLAGQDHTPLSGEELYSQINGGQDRGSMLDDGIYALKENGVADWRPEHRERFRERAFTEQDRKTRKDNKALEAYGVDTELELATGLALGFVGVVAVHATNNFMRLDHKGIVHPSSGPGNHAVGVDDVTIIDGKLAFDMFNSWGTQYGDKGRGYLLWNEHLREPNQYHYFYLIRAVAKDESDNVPELRTKSRKPVKKSLFSEESKDEEYDEEYDTTPTVHEPTRGSRTFKTY